MGIDIIEGYNYKYQTYGGKSELLGLFEQFDPKIIINDVGNTSYEYMVDLTNKGYYIINFEDFGSGSDLADLVFDSLYEHEGDEKFFVGHEYYILKDALLYIVNFVKSEKTRIEMKSEIKKLKEMTC